MPLSRSASAFTADVVKTIYIQRMAPRKGHGSSQWRVEPIVCLMIWIALPGTDLEAPYNGLVGKSR